MTAILNADGTESEAAEGAPEGAAGGDLIKDSNTDQFGDDVINASTEVPVIVDFWAPWCEPCKQLGPALEKLVQEYAGKVRLVKINVDENQALAQQLRVQSIPMVYAFKDGRPADAFTGALPESQLRSFIEKLTGNAGSPVDQALEQAKALLDGGDPTTASAIFNQIISADGENAAAHAGVAKCLMAAGETEQARLYLAGLTPELLSSDEVSAVQTALELDEMADQGGDTSELQAKVDASPDDHQARFDLAVALYGGGNSEQAIDELVEIIRRNQAWNDDAAKQQLLKIFEALGFNDPLAVEGRRKLSSILFS